MNRRERRRKGKGTAGLSMTSAAAEQAFAAAVKDFQAGAWAEAERRLKPLREAFPDHPEVLYLLGLSVLQAGRVREAIGPLQHAARLAPGRADVLNALGSALRRDGQVAAAIAALEQALALEPAFTDAHYNLGNALKDAGRYAEAERHYREAIAREPNFADAHYGLGLVLRALGRTDEAIAEYQEAIRLVPGHADVHISLGSAFSDRSQTHLARRAYETALAIDPDNATALGNLGNALTTMGRLEEGIAKVEKAVALDPDNAAMHSNLIFHCHYSPAYGSMDLLRLARQWNDRHGRPRATNRKPHRNDRDPDRRLRIGYVSGDFRVHPVGWFMTPVFAAHDTSAVETFAYSASAYADDLTRRIQAGVGHWREVAGVSESDLAATIRADRIDILVDLAGHTARHRLLAFAEKPAPVQVTAVVPGTSGVEAIDYFLSDRFETPPGSEAHFSETVIRLPDGFHCYGPPPYAPDVAPLPARANSAVTFGCFNNLAKVTPQVIALWAKVLAAVPGARLLLKTKALDDPDAQAWYRELTAAAGIAPERLMLAGGAPHAELLAAYGEVDITLDPFPYSGGLTTTESLWMGVPVITLSGETFAGRHSTSHLANVGLPELIAATPQDYVAIAAGLADDRDRLAGLRASLRARMAASPICDAQRYTRNLEAAYRAMWRAWCAGEGRAYSP